MAQTLIYVEEPSGSNPTYRLLLTGVSLCRKGIDTLNYSPRRDDDGLFFLFLPVFSVDFCCPRKKKELDRNPILSK